MPFFTTGSPRYAPPNALAARPSRRVGFTLIELLVVVVIIGILAAIAIPKYKATKGKAYFASMKSDLHNLATAEESYFYSHNQYSKNLDSLGLPTSHGNVVTIGEATNVGWSATSNNPESYPHLCAIFMGAAAPVSPATVSGEVACK